MRGAGVAILTVAAVAFVAISAVWLPQWKNPDAIATLEEKPPRSSPEQRRVANGHRRSDYNPSSASVHSLSLEGEQGASAANAESRNEPPEYSPEQEAETRAKELRALRLIYEDVASAARLSDAETEALIDLLFNQQTELFGLDADPVNSLAGAVAHNEMLARHRAEIAALVGSSKAEAVMDYQKAMDARFQVEDLRRQLESAGMPITEEQRRGLIKTAVERGAYVPMPEFTGASSAGAMAQELLARVQQRDQKMLQVARSLLSTSQVSWYEELLQQRHNTMESSLRESSKAID